ncbi:MAG: tetratricopeptide repeat protein [Promethearchaeota archaeon]
MKPLGTITKYYPFIDEESKSMLNSLMDESSSYYDFMLELCEFVLENEVPIDVAYIAAMQAWWTRSGDTMSRIQQKYRDFPCIRPWGFRYASTISDQARYHDAVVEAIDRAIETSPPDWMLIEFYFLHSRFHLPIFGDIPSLLEPIEMAKVLIAANPLLRCFEPLICFIEGWAELREGHKENSIAIHQRGLELAEVDNDPVIAYENLSCLANATKFINIKKSQELWEEVYDSVQDLEVPSIIGEVLHDSALAFETAGEYDLAISSLLEYIDVGSVDDTVCLTLSRIYATMGNGQKALEWIDRTFEYVGSLTFPTLYLRKAWALVLLNRLEEAERNLDTAHSLILKTGQEIRLARYYHVSGVLELARGDHSAAVDFLEKSYEIMDRFQEGLYLNISLLDLVRAEISLADQSIDSTESVTPGTWLTRLEKYARNRNLPGIRMQAALLKSEFYQKHGQLKDALGTLEDALDITDSLGVKTLRKMITDRIAELERLLKEA